MAIRKASDSNLTGKKYNDASAGATKIPDLPESPTSLSTSGTDTVSVSFTAPLRGGAVTNYSGVTTPATNTRTSATSPMSFSGLTPGTAYTFKVQSVNATGSSPFSAETASVTISGWTLAQTFNSTSNWTVPSTTNKIGVVVISGGGSGGGSGNNGGGGGSSGSAVGFYDHTVTPGTNYLVTVGGTSGTSSFGSLANAVSGGNATSNVVTNRIIANAVGGGSGATSGSNANAGSPSSPANITLAIPVNGPYNHPHGGGGGGGAWPQKSGAGGGQSFGGGSDSGGAGPGGGGGGGSRPYAADNNNPGGSGAAGRVFVYTFTP